MINSNFNPILKYMLLLPVLIFAGCNMDYSDSQTTLDELSLKSSSLSKGISLLSENKEFLEGLRSMAANPTGKEILSEDLNAKSNAKWVAMANGGGKDLYPDFEEPNFEITFNAREDADGNDVGKVNWKDIEGNVIASGEVDCLYVDGNRAWIRYVADIGGDLWYVYIGFEDNGEGSGAELDRHTFIFGGLVEYGGGSCEYFAESNGFGYGFPVEWVRGNVQVF